MPKPENLEPRVNVAEFLLAQHSKPSPKSRRSITPGRQANTNFHHSNSPRRRHVSGSRDIVQEVYDRMGVNYVRGQNSVEICDSDGPISTNSEISKVSHTTASNVSRAGVSTDFVKQRSSSFGKRGQSLSINTRNEVHDEDRDDYHSTRSTRSVKSLMSAFSGGKSVASRNFPELRSPSIQKNVFKSTPKYVNTTPGEEVREKIIACRDSDMDANMSVISTDESQWTGRKQQHQEEEEKIQASRNGDFRGRRASFQTSTSDAKSTVAAKPHNAAQAMSKTSNDLSSTINDISPTGLRDETINKIIEEKLQAKIAELNLSFEENFRRLEEHTNRRLEEIELKLTESLKSKDSSIDYNVLDNLKIQIQGK